MTNLSKKTLSFFILVLLARIAGAQTSADGLAAMQLENWDKAISIYTSLSKSNPADQDALMSLGNAYLAKGETAKANEAFTAAFNVKPEGGMAFVALARQTLLKGQDEEAEKQLARAAKNGKKDPATMRQRGETFLYFTKPGSKAPNYVRAEQLLKEAYDINSKDFPTLMSLGYAYAQLGKGGEAVQYYEYAARLQPQNPLPLYMMGKVYRAAKLQDKAFEYLDKAIAVNPKYTPALRSKAEFYYQSRKWEKALEAYRNLINNGAEVVIEDEMAYANTLFINKDCKGVSEVVEKILKKDGSKNYLRRLQAYCDYENGDYPRGLELINDYFKNVPADKIISSDYEYRAKLTLKTKGDTLMAIKDYGLAMQQDSDKWQLHKEISDLLYNRKDYCGSAREFRTYMDSLPKPSANDFYLLGVRYLYCREDTAHLQKAMDAFGQVITMVPDASTGYYWSARTAVQMEPDIVTMPEKLPEFGKARPFYEKYVEKAGVDKEKNKKNLIEAYEYLAYYYFVKNENDNARNVIQKLLELSPDNDTGKKLQEEMDKNPNAPKTPKPPAPPTPPGTPGGGGGSRN